MSKKTPTSRSWIFILAGVLLLGTGPLFVKTVPAGGLFIAFYRMLFGSMLLGIPILAGKRKVIQKKNTSGGILWAILGGLSYGLNIFLWSSALKFTTASAVTLLDNTAPLWVGLYGFLFLKEKQGWIYRLGMAVTFGGAAMLIGTNTFSRSNAQLTGSLISIASGFSYAIYQVITRKAREYFSSLQYSWMVAAVGAAGLFLIAFPLGILNHQVNLSGFLKIFLLALTSQVLAWLMINQALGELPSSVTSLVLVGQPVVTTLLAALLINEVPGLWQILGGMICIAGIFIIQRNTSPVFRKVRKLDA